MKSSIAIFICLIILSGCASIVGGRKYTALINTKENKSAMILINGNYAGMAEAQTKVRRAGADNLVITVFEPGCEEKKIKFEQKVLRGWATVGTLLSFTGFFNGIPIPIGLLFDISTGALWKPDTQDQRIRKYDYDTYSYSIDYGCLKSPNYISRLIAVKETNDQEALKNVSMKDIDWRVRKVAFNKLTDTSLRDLIERANDPAVVTASKIKLGLTTWPEVVSGSNINTQKAGTFIGAAALVESPQPTSSDVVKACHFFICKGDSSRIPELRDLLLRFGDKTLAEDYLNCGKKELAEASHEWAAKHGFRVNPAGGGSHRVIWGEGAR